MRAWVMLGCGILLSGWLVSCQYNRPPPRYSGSFSCSIERLREAGIAYEEARQYMADYFAFREDQAIYDAYQSSVDAVRLARSAKSCADYGPLVRTQILTVLHSNWKFQRLVRENMRDEDPSHLMHVLGDRYRELFLRDIR